MRAARTPPEPAPMTNRSTSSDMVFSLPRPIPGQEPERLHKALAALLHLGAELGVDFGRKRARPVVRGLHGFLQRLGFFGNELLPERRFVERQRVLEFLLGEMRGVDARQ